MWRHSGGQLSASQEESSHHKLTATLAPRPQPFSFQNYNEIYFCLNYSVDDIFFNRGLSWLMQSISISSLEIIFPPRLYIRFSELIHLITERCTLWPRSPHFSLSATDWAVGVELRLLLLKVESFRLNPRAQPVVYLKRFSSQTTGAKTILFGEEGLIGRRWGSKSHHIIVEIMYLGINQINISLSPNSSKS